MEPQINFCASADGTRIAYAICGSGPPLVQIAGWGATIEHDYGCDQEGLGNVVEALSARCRLMLIDRRGTGASERKSDSITLDSAVEDLEAAVSAAGWDCFDLFGISDGCLVAAAYAVNAPERVRRLVLWAPFREWSSFVSRSFVQAMRGLVRENWGVARRSFSQAVFPSGPTTMQLHTADAFREAMSREMAEKYLEFQLASDVRSILPSIGQPTLVLHRRGDKSVPIAEGRAVAATIPNARFVALDGDHHVPTDHRSFLPYLWDFLEYGPRSNESARSAEQFGTATILFADIADSTALTERLGDDAFRDKARTLDGTIRRTMREAQGTPIDGKVLGDGVMGVFSSAARAIEAARRCVAAGALLELPLHVGIHAGDVIRDGENVFGGTVNIASRICGLSAPGEVLVSDVVRGMARTSADATFEDRGARELKGIADPIRVFAVRGGREA
jgi:class 3 adenylate cyclase/pimeloyl-ACP methyl ester carboxylesterase